MINDVSLSAASSCTSTWRPSRNAGAAPAGRHDHRPDGGRARPTSTGTHRLYDLRGRRFADLLVSAGTETVARLLGWAACLLDEHPDQRADLAADPACSNAVEELLRYEAPSPVQGRWTTRESSCTA